jgi:transcriptional regulator with XRE-family HTH domain
VSDQRFGTVIRLVRLRRGWRQADLARSSNLSQASISRIERGHLGTQSVDAIRAAAAALDIRVDVVPRWRGGDLDRLLNARHSALHEAVARWFKARYPAWELAPEVSFAIYADRGIIDILAWHPGRRAILVIELKTQISDVNELLGTFDRKRRLAKQIAKSRGWDATTVSAWLIVADSRTNRRRIETHETMLRAALPGSTRGMRAWLKDPVVPFGALSFWPDTGGSKGGTRTRR